MLYHKICNFNNYADMWPDQRWTPEEGAKKSPLHQDSNADRSEENFWILAAPILTTGSVSRAPGDSMIFSGLVINSEKSIESSVESFGA